MIRRFKLSSKDFIYECGEGLRQGVNCVLMPLLTARPNPKGQYAEEKGVVAIIDASVPLSWYETAFVTQSYIDLVQEVLSLKDKVEVAS